MLIDMVFENDCFIIEFKRGMMSMMILQLNQSAYENGKKSGEYFKKTMSLEALNQALGSDKKRKWNDKYEALLLRLKKEYPCYYDEIRGKAEGLQVDFKEYFMLMCPELSQIQNEQCTTILCKKENGHYLLCHNEDDRYIGGNFCLAKIKVDEKHWFVTNDMVNMPFGNGISWNSDGIVKTINYTHEESFNENELPRYFKQRFLSEASSIEDCIERCKKMKTASGFHVNIIDLKSHQAASIEVYKEDVSVKWIEDFAVHSNHYVHNDYSQEPKCDEGSNSLFRYHQALKMMKESQKEVGCIKNILDYQGIDFMHSIYQDENAEQRTIFNFLFDTEYPEKIKLDIYVLNEKKSLDYFKLD